MNDRNLQTFSILFLKKSNAFPFSFCSWFFPDVLHDPESSQDSATGGGHFMRNSNEVWSTSGTVTVYNLLLTAEVISIWKTSTNKKCRTDPKVMLISLLYKLSLRCACIGMFLRYVAKLFFSYTQKERFKFRDYLSVIELEIHCLPMLLFWQ